MHGMKVYKKFLRNLKFKYLRVVVFGQMPLYRTKNKFKFELRGLLIHTGINMYLLKKNKK